MTRTTAQVVCLSLSIVWLAGCQQTVSFELMDALTKQPLSDVYVERSVVTARMPLLRTESVEAEEYGEHLGPTIQHVAPRRNETWSFRKLGYEETRIQIDGRDVYLMAPSTSVPVSNFMEALIKGDPFDRSRAKRLRIPGNGTVVAPMYPRDDMEQKRSCFGLMRGHE